MSLPEIQRSGIDSPEYLEALRKGPQAMLEGLKADVEAIYAANQKFKELKLPSQYAQQSAIAGEHAALMAVITQLHEQPREAAKKDVAPAQSFPGRVAALATAVKAAEQIPTLEESIVDIEQKLAIPAGTQCAVRLALDGLKQNLADPQGEIAKINETYEALGPRIPPLLAFANETAKYANQKELVQPFIDRVLKDNADPAAELTALQTRMGAVIEDQQNTAEDASIPEEPTLAERLQNWVDGMGEDSKFKAPMAKLVGAVSAIGIALAKLPFFGDKVRGVLVSNEVLAKNGDKTAAKAVKAEGHLKKFGLPKALANSECLVPVKKFTDAVGKGADTMDAARAAQLRQLAGQLTAYTNSHTSSVAEKTTVLDILAAPDFKPRYKAASAAAADTSPTDNAPVPTPAATAEEKKPLRNKPPRPQTLPRPGQ